MDTGKYTTFISDKDCEMPLFRISLRVGQQKKKPENRFLAEGQRRKEPTVVPQALLRKLQTLHIPGKIAREDQEQELLDVRIVVAKAKCYALTR